MYSIYYTYAVFTVSTYSYQNAVSWRRQKAQASRRTKQLQWPSSIASENHQGFGIRRCCLNPNNPNRFFNAFHQFHPAFHPIRQGHHEDAVRVFHSTKCLRHPKRTGGAVPQPKRLDALDWTDEPPRGCAVGYELPWVRMQGGWNWALESQSQTFGVLFLWKSGYTK